VKPRAGGPLQRDAPRGTIDDGVEVVTGRAADIEPSAATDRRGM
jgi:hypothetical protein